MTRTTKMLHGNKVRTGTSIVTEEVDITDMDPIVLQQYCSQNQKICEKNDLWDNALRKRFPDIHSSLYGVTFPDLEKDIRGTERKFIPLRELYTQLLTISANSGLLAAVNDILSEEDTSLSDTEHHDYLRLYYQILSYLLAVISPKWREFLIVKNDLLLEYLPFTAVEVKLRWQDASKLAIRYFLDPLVDLAENHNYAICWASKNGHEDVVELLLKDERVNPADNYNWAIRWAAKNGHRDVVELLLKDKRVNPAALNNNAIFVAAENGHTGIIELLVRDRRVNPADNHNDAIFVAAENGHTGIIELLVRGRHVNHADNHNDAIHWAADGGPAAIIELLIKDER